MSIAADNGLGLESFVPVDHANKGRDEVKDGVDKPVGLVLKRGDEVDFEDLSIFFHEVIVAFGRKIMWSSVD